MSDPMTISSDQAAQVEQLPATLLQALFDHAADCMVVMNSSREILYMNRAAIGLTGCDHPQGAFCGSQFHCQGDQRASLAAEGCFGLCVMASRTAMIDVEMTIRARSGNMIPVTVTYSRIPGEDGESYLLMSLRDISERKRFEQEQRQKEELRYTLQERERLARDLHDGVVQDIAYASMRTKSVLEDLVDEQASVRDDLQSVSAVLDKSVGGLRQAIYDLTFRVTENIEQYVERYVSEFQTRNAITTEFRCENVPPRLPSFITSQLAKLLQEALTNVGKHAHARHVSVRLGWKEDTSSPGNGRLMLSVIDDGVGFDSTEPAGTSHFGMRTMRDRSRLMGGQLHIESSHGQGTSLHLEVPVGE